MSRLLRTLTTLLCALLALAPVTAGTAHAQGAGLQREEWALRALHAKEAWKTTKGRGITVAVLDTGVDGSHPDLHKNVSGGKDMVGMGAKKGDRAWARHGTAMAGIIAGHGHGKGGKDGVLGIAPEARILPVRVLLEDTDPQRAKARGERNTALADGIRWAADHGADVINLSLGDDSSAAHPDAREDAAVRYALGKGAVVVASAGNGGEDGDHVSYPAAYPGVIAVAAVDRNGARAAFSTRRWYATVAAPGKDILIADPDRSYYQGWGTSAAAAFTSGAVALVRAAHPDLSPAQIKELISDTAGHTPQGGRSDAVGTGVVDPAAAIEMGSHIEPREQQPPVGKYSKEYFGSADSGDEAGPGWFATLAAVLGALLIGVAFAVHRGFTPRVPPRLRSRVRLPGSGSGGGRGFPGGP
ncbi:type VII secretion-associated serine protease mycosin [Streptomyces oryzae]|uniref:Type VII secretion-associated serine protease mycosin n=1 Tax=Streptomyces oryzae TaxID=1434886 RepID=A0ABS3X5P7_9ACTN|nr:type VII secretion-associated serine protease mycosin [Streptomyces oryzae]MBO8190697.1 type VII secretion-associated serine protease mycosin [Streptomyces oryzae]